MISTIQCLTNLIRHSRDYHEVIRHCVDIVHLELPESFIQITIKEIHEINQLKSGVNSNRMELVGHTSVGVQSETSSLNPRMSPKNMVTHLNSSIDVCNKFILVYKSTFNHKEA